MTKTPTTSGPPFRLCLYFAMNPGTSLSTQDLRQRFGFAQSRLHSAFRLALRHGWLESESQARGCKGTTIYRAGPRLLREIARE